MKIFLVCLFFIFSQVSEANAGLLNILNNVFSSSNIEQVKNGYLEFDKSITLGDALDNYKFFKLTKWTEFESDQGRTIIEFTGDIDLIKVAEDALDLPGLYGNGFGGPSWLGMEDKEKMKVCLRDRNNCILSKKEYTVIIQFIMNNDDTFELSYIGHSTNNKEFSQEITQIKDIFKNKNIIPFTPATILYESK